MPMIRAMRLLNAIEAGTTTASQLETLLSSDAGRLADFRSVLNMRGHARRIAESPTAMAAIAGSATASAAVAANANAMKAVSFNPVAVGAVVANTTGNDAIMASPYYIGRFLDTLNVKNGGTTNATLCTFNKLTDLASDATQMAIVANNTYMCNAIALSRNAMTTITNNTTAVTAMYNKPLVGNTILQTSSHKVGAYFNQVIAINGGTTSATLAGIESITAIANNSTAATALAASQQAMNALTNSNASCVAMAANTIGNNAIYGGVNYVGRYLDQITIANGGTTDATRLAATTAADLATNYYGYVSWTNAGAVSTMYKSQNMVAAIFASVAASTNAIGGAKAGAYFNALLVKDGVTSNSALEASNALSDIVLSTPATTAIASSTSAMAALGQHTTQAILAPFYSSETANNIILQSNYGVGYYIDTISVSSNANLRACQTMAQVVSDATSMSVLVGYQSGMNAVTFSDHAVGLLKANTVANNYMYGSAYSVGAYVERIIKLGGGARNPTLAAAASWSSVLADSAMLTAIFANASATASIVASQYANGAMLTNATGVGQYLNTVLVNGGGTSNSTLSGKATIAEVAADSVAVTAIAGSSAAMNAISAHTTSSVTSTFINAPASSNILLGSSYYVGQYVQAIYYRYVGSQLPAISALSTMADVAGNAAGMTSLCANQNTMIALFQTVNAKTAFWSSDNALTKIAAATTAMNAARSVTAYGYSVKSATESGTTSVSLSTQLGASGKYIILGYSRSTAASVTAVVNSLRSGSTIGNSNASSATAATTGIGSAACAIPVTNPFSFSLSGAGTGTAYFGTLRCDA